MTATDPQDLRSRLAQALAGQYVIEWTLGQGGMGTVFLARDVTLDRDVAIKVVTPDMGTSPELRQRFALEARTVARLRHPNIVAVYAAGEADGLLYFVMEYVPGESLRERINRQKAHGVDDAVPILRDIALALDYAHASGIVHRDVKPENVLLDRDSGRAMLTDFGVARALADPGQLTGVGFVLGSPRYMSPEQASGDQTLDGRSDLFSLGLIAYELFTGAPAVEAATAATALIKQITEKQEPLSKRVASVPSDIGKAVDKLLEKAPALRFQRGASFAAALTGEPFDATAPIGHIGRMSGAGRRNSKRNGRRNLAITALSVLAVLSAFVVYSKSAAAHTNDREWFVAPFEVQGPDRSLDWLREGSLNMLTLSLARWNDLHVIGYERTLDLLRDEKLEGQPRVGLEDARKLARRAGAGRVVMGQVTAMGDSLIVTASLFDVASGRSTDKARVAAVKGSDPRPAFESIASELLDLVGAPRITFELARQTTASVEAYRFYLEGLRALNGWRLRAADSAFSRAIAADSTFALAYYKRSLALGWEGTVDTMRTIAADKAVQFADRLPPNRQELVRAHAELTRGFTAMSKSDTAETRSSFLASRNRLARLVATDTTDAESWYALADADFHLIFNTSYGFSPDSTAKYLTESLRGFQRTIRIDSTFHLAYQHLVELYGRAATPGSYLVLVGDTIKPGGAADDERRIGTDGQIAQLRAQAQTRAREAAGGWVASDPDAINARTALANLFEQMSQPDSAIGVLREALARPATADPSFLWRVAFIKAKAGMPSAGPELRALLDRYPVDSLRRFRIGDRLNGLFGAMSVGGQVGMPSLVDEASSRLRETDPTLPGGSGNTAKTSFVTAWLTSGIKVGMGIPMTPSSRALLLDGIATLEGDSAGAGRRDPTIPYMVYLETRDSAFATVARRWSSSTSNGFPEIRALTAIQRGDTVEAARLAQSFPSPDSLRRAALGMSGMRSMARATVLAELGDLRRATEVYESIDPSRFAQNALPESAWPMYVRSYLARGHLFEQLGDRAGAMRSYERFLSLWQDAEAPLHPQLRVAREALARLRDAGGVAVKATVR